MNTDRITKKPIVRIVRCVAVIIAGTAILGVAFRMAPAASAESIETDNHNAELAEQQDEEILKSIRNQPPQFKGLSTVSRDINPDRLIESLLTSTTVAPAPGNEINHIPANLFRLATLYNTMCSTGSSKTKAFLAIRIRYVAEMLWLGFERVVRQNVLSGSDSFLIYESYHQALAYYEENTDECNAEFNKEERSDAEVWGLVLDWWATTGAPPERLSALDGWLWRAVPKDARTGESYEDKYQFHKDGDFILLDFVATNFEAHFKWHKTEGFREGATHSGPKLRLPPDILRGMNERTHMP